MYELMDEWQTRVVWGLEVSLNLLRSVPTRRLKTTNTLLAGPAFPPPSMEPDQRNKLHRKTVSRVFPEHPFLKESPEWNAGARWLLSTTILKVDPHFWCNLLLENFLHVVPGQWDIHLVWQKKQPENSLFPGWGSLLSLATQESQQPCQVAACWQDRFHIYYTGIILALMERTSNWKTECRLPNRNSASSSCLD